MNIRDEIGKKLLYFDGGLGTLLQKRGLQRGELPELWNLTKADELVRIHGEYLEAGADILLANTFGANRFKYKDNLTEIITAGIKNAKTAVECSNRQAYVALDIGSTGKLLKPLGDLAFETAVEAFAEIVIAGEKAGADFILIETMSDTYELKAAVLAAKENSSLPVMATVIFDESRKMLTGSSPKGVVALLEGLGVDALGINCGLGPKQMKGIVEELAACCSIPLIVNPNAGLPRTEDGQTIYEVNPEEFAEDMAGMVTAGAWLVGGCCGTTPAHIKALTSRCADILPPPVTDKALTLVSSYSKVVEIGNSPVTIGERINPAGNAELEQALREQDLDYLLDEAFEQMDDGAHILGINVGGPEQNDVEMLPEAVSQIQEVIALPLRMDTANPAALEQALRIYNGKAMIRLVSREQEVLEQILPLVKKYGGVVAGAIPDEGGDGRFAIAEKIDQMGERYGIARKDIIIDALTGSTDSLGLSQLLINR